MALVGALGHVSRKIAKDGPVRCASLVVADTPRQGRLSCTPGRDYCPIDSLGLVCRIPK